MALKKYGLYLALAVIASSFGSSCSNSAGTDKKEITTDLVNIPASGTGETNTDQMPVFEFVTETYDFGTITQGEKVSYSYRFKNVGKTNLIIASAKGSCGCTVPEFPKKPIAPGEEAKINVIFDSDGKSGKQNKTVSLVANTYPGTKILTITGDIVAPKGENQDGRAGYQ